MDGCMMDGGMAEKSVTFYNLSMDILYTYKGTVGCCFC